MTPTRILAGTLLPPAPAPVGLYRAVLIHGHVGWVSGQFPIRDGKLGWRGTVGHSLTEEEGYAAAECAALNVLAQIGQHLDGFDRLASLLRVEGTVASATGFLRQPAVLDGASALFLRLLGDRGAHTRAAFSSAQLPLDAPVELVVTFAVI